MTYKPTGNPPGRPTLGYSKRKWCESVKALKALIANPKTQVEHKLRGVELLMLIYGIQAPETRTDKLAVKELVMRRNLDQAVAGAVDRRIEQQEIEQESKRLTQAELEDQQNMERMFAEILHEGDQ